MAWCSPRSTPIGCSSCSAPSSSPPSASTAGAPSTAGPREMNLSVETVTKSFPGVRALDGVSLDLKGGEIHALMGENGAGKSTLVKIVTGLYRPDSGRILIDGAPVAFGSPRDALQAGISAVHQERNLIPRFSVGENILLGGLPTRWPLVDRATGRREARRP